MGCFNIQSQNWMTWMLRINTGIRVADPSGFDIFPHFVVQLWGMARGSTVPTLVFDWNDQSPGYFPMRAGGTSEALKFLALWMFPYMTLKDPLQVHPLAQAWYAQAIVSTQIIAFPNN